MNKYYYPINLIESIDKLFLPSYSEILFYIFMAIFVLACVALIQEKMELQSMRSIISLSIRKNLSIRKSLIM